MIREKVLGIHSLTTFECMARDFSLPKLFTGAATAEWVAEGVVLFCWKNTPAATKGLPKLDRRGERAARRKAVENSLKVWRRNSEGNRKA